MNAENVKDGISVTVSSDKEKYNSESDIKVENILSDGISNVFYKLGI